MRLNALGLKLKERLLRFAKTVASDSNRPRLAWAKDVVPASNVEALIFLENALTVDTLDHTRGKVRVDRDRQAVVSIHKEDWPYFRFGNGKWGQALYRVSLTSF